MGEMQTKYLDDKGLLSLIFGCFLPCLMLILFIFELLYIKIKTKIMKHIITKSKQSFNWINV